MSNQPSDEELDAKEARANAPMAIGHYDPPSCQHPERGHAPACRRCENEALVAEVRRLRTLLEGRATTPTAAEADALEAEDGCWLVTLDWGDGGPPVLDLYSAWNVRQYTERSEAKGDDLSCRVVMWRALDRDGRPCAWPTVTP